MKTLAPLTFLPAITSRPLNPNRNQKVRLLLSREGNQLRGPQQVGKVERGASSQLTEASLGLFDFNYR